MPNVAFVRPEIANLLPLYYLIRDAISGEVAVKKARTKYLPMPNAADMSLENKARYEAYLLRAVFYNVARRTLHGLVGQVFLTDPVVKVPATLQPTIDNATGSGISATQLAMKAVSLNLAYSRAGIMIDYPTVEADEGDATSVADLEAGNIRPILSVYSPQEIINWRTCERGSEEILCLVVLFETFSFQDDGFEMKTACQFRVLRLDAKTGDYVHEIWREPQPTKNDGTKVKNGNYQIHKTYYPKGSDGLPLKDIPFMFMGSENNDSVPDNPNFYDICSLNIAHYRNSADYEESCYIVGQATPVLTGLDEEWVKNVLKGTVDFGSRGGIPLPKGGDAKLLQAEPNTMLKEAMDTKERQMVALGAKLVEQITVQRTATEAEIESASEGSILSSSTKNVSAAFTWALKWAARWIGQPDTGIQFDLNTDFDIANLSTEERAQAVKEWQANAITFEEMRTVLRRAKIATEDDAKAKTQISADMVEAMALMPQPDNTPGGNVGNSA